MGYLKNVLNMVVGSASLSLMMISTNTFAQAGEENSVLEEVLVTARKKEENVLDIPVSVNVISSNFIDNANLISLNDLAQVTPGFKINSAFGRQADRPVIRGLSSISTSSGLAGFFIDGVFVEGSLQSYDLDSIERVEIIKGPQSATFGRRTFTGAINYVTQAPTEDTEIKVKAQLGSNSYELFSVTASGTEGRFGYRANVRSFNYDGDFNNTLATGPDDIGGQKSLSGNVSLFYYPGDNTTVQFNANYADDDDEQYAITLQPSSENNCVFGTREFFCGTFDGNVPVSLGGILPVGDYGVQRERFRSFVRITHDFEWAELMWTTAYNTLNYFAGQDQTFAGLQQQFSFATFGLVPATGFHTRDIRETDDFSHELWLRGTASEGRLSWGAGLYYFDSETDSQSINFDNSRNGINTLDVTNTALMATVEYDFSDRFRAGLELRYAEDEIDQLLSDANISNSGDFDSLTYRLTGSWFLENGSLLYANWATGVLPGQFNSDERLPESLRTVDEQELEQFEFGIKTDLSDSVSLIAAIYALEWKDQIRSQFLIIDGTPVGFQANQGTTDLTGLELSATWRTSDSLTLTGGFSYNDSEVNDFISADATDVAITGDGDVSGAQLPLSAELEAHASATYTIPLNNGMEFSGRLDYSFQDSRFVRLVNLAEIDDESIVNLNLSLSRDNWKWTLWGKNITDEDSPVSGLRYIEADSFFFGGRAFALTPRPGTEWGITATYSF